LAPPGYLLAEVAGVVGDEAGLHHTVILVRKGEAGRGTVPEKALLITVGGMEGTAIAMAVAKKAYVRPLTHDLTSQILTRLESRVRGLYIHSLQKETFFARLELESRGDGPHSFDCRPSDGLALALRAEAPIWVDAKVFEKAALNLTGKGIPKPPAKPPEAARSL